MELILLNSHAMSWQFRFKTKLQSIGAYPCRLSKQPIVVQELPAAVAGKSPILTYGFLDQNFGLGSINCKRLPLSSL